MVKGQARLQVCHEIEADGRREEVARERGVPPHGRKKVGGRQWHLAPGAQRGVR